MNHGRVIAYFSMEIALESTIPTYSGGLGVLAGDTLRSAADLKLPLVGMTLLHRKGYFRQSLDPQGAQREAPVEWTVENVLEEMPARAAVEIEGRTVQLRVWRYEIRGIGGFRAPVYLLDSDLPENSAWDRTLTHYLYGGDEHYRFCQEVVLGIGGVRMLRALGYDDIARVHLNEGHASLLALELLDEAARKSGRPAFTAAEIEAVREQCVFTTHTPVPAGHDKFPLDLVERVLRRQEFRRMQEIFCYDGLLNLTFMALNLSGYVNGVAKRHGEVSRLMFARYNIDAITNGVHAASWTARPFQELYDRYLPGWRADNFNLRYALSIPKLQIWNAHTAAKKQLIERVNRGSEAAMDPDVLTLGFGRRAATYKRADLLFHDLDRLRALAAKTGSMQIIYSGKAHPKDQGGKELIRRIFEARAALKDQIKIAYLEDYNMELGKLMTSGVDVWLNTPQPPLEASGTSGMKAALNGVPSLSVLDGWWIEGHIEGVTGWSIGEPDRASDAGDERSSDAASLYDKLEQIIIPSFYFDRFRFVEVMLHSIALNGSFFNTHRMLQQYVLKAYF